MSTASGITSGRVLLLGGYTASTGGTAAGIGSLSSRTADAALAYDLVATAASPSFIAYGRGVVYAVDEEGGRVEAFVDEGASLRYLSGRPTSGTAPCHITVTEKWLYVSNYGTGDVDVFPIEQGGAIGSLHQSLAGSHARTGPHPAQEAAHAHSTLVIGDTVLIANLGLDRIDLHRWRAGRLEPWVHRHSGGMRSARLRGHTGWRGLGARRAVGGDPSVGWFWLRLLGGSRPHRLHGRFGACDDPGDAR